MSAPTDRNRLDEEASPYLRQHADNPVHWQPWDEDALAAARERDVPIFLSIGYSACHWCHVMEEESFADEEVAEVLNEHFVPVKVDREERPDVDSVYQTLCQMVSGQGGWPLSVWLTPEGKPFYVGTYFPRDSKYGRPGFVGLLERLVETWENERGTVEDRAEEWTRAVKGELESLPEGDRDPDDPVVDVADAAVRGADRQHGGWGSGPKFPQPGRIEALLAAHEQTGDDEYLSVAGEVLDAMADGGMYDQVGGGFHRYATDRDWTVPHFEKMLYDNAELPRVYLAAYQIAGRERYVRVARETFEFVERELSHPGGGFFSTLDARSPQLPSRTDDGDPGEDVEGVFYTWTPDEVHDALDDQELAELVCERHGITEEGNFEGTTVLTLAAPIEALAEARDADPAALRERLEDARERLRAAREERPRPRRDEKVIASWNGLAIRAFAEGAIVLEDEALADRAVDALAFVHEHLWDGRRLARRYKDVSEEGGRSTGDVQGNGYLEDYAFIGRGAIACYESTGDVEHLAFALDLAAAIEEEFWDAEDGTLYFTPAEGEQLIARPQEPRDQSTPSSLGVAVDLLATLDAFVPHDRFETIAAAAVDAHGARIAGRPLEHATLGLAAGRLRDGSIEITLAAAERPDAWREWLADRYLPQRLIAQRPPTEDDLGAWIETLGLDEAPPIWAGREARDGVTGYVCRNFACSPPCETPGEADAWLDADGDGVHLESDPDDS